MKSTLNNWDPENEIFWKETGKKIANRNLIISISCLFLSFIVWMLWSVIAVHLNNVGFHFTKAQLFTLTAVPGVTGALLRIVNSFVVPIFGGRNWIVISTASLLIPTIGISIAIQDPTTSYTTMLILAALCGIGGGNFSSSMANISFFFPKKSQGTVLGLNAGLGNLGVSALQFIAPLVIGFSLFGSFGGQGQIWKNGDVIKSVWIQNEALIWVIPIVLCTILAFFWMNNLKTARASLSDQCVIFKRKHTYLMTWLYTMSFGSFIGYSAAFPLLIKTLFPSVNPFMYAFLGPLVGALIRSAGGWLSDKVGGALVTVSAILVMIVATTGIIYFIQPENLCFSEFLISFLVVFAATGTANGSIFQMIGVIFPPKEKAPVLGFSAAIAAIGAFYIPQAFAYSLQLTGTVNTALWFFVAYYVICFFVTWRWYCRKGSIVETSMNRPFA